MAASASSHCGVKRPHDSDLEEEKNEWHMVSTPWTQLINGAAAALSSSAAAAAAAAASPSLPPPPPPIVPSQIATSSVLLPARADHATCELCFLAFETTEKRDWESQSHIPRCLPCGHTFCTTCCAKILAGNNGFLPCPQRCADAGGVAVRRKSVLEVPKNHVLFSLLERLQTAEATRDIVQPPCQQCDPEKPRQAAVVWCTTCCADYCQQHVDEVHRLPALASHIRVGMMDKLRLQQEASKKDVLIAAAAGNVKTQLRVLLSEHQTLQKEVQGQLAIRHTHPEQFTRATETADMLRAVAGKLDAFVASQRALRENGYAVLEGEKDFPGIATAIQSLIDDSDVGIVSRSSALQLESAQLMAKVRRALWTTSIDILSASSAFALQRLCAQIKEPHTILPADLQANQIYDVLDPEANWYQATIVNVTVIHGDVHVRVHYINWSAKCDETIICTPSILATRFALKCTYTLGPHVPKHTRINKSRVAAKSTSAAHVSVD